MKTNNYIGKKGSQTLYYAAEVARRKGLPLNYCITINFKETDIALLEINSVFLEFKRQFTRWLKSSSKYKKSIEPTFAWVFENHIRGKGFHSLDKDHNIHVHLAMYIPKGYKDEVIAKVVSILKKLTIINDRTVHLGDTLRNPSLSYLIKGCHPNYIDIYGRGQEAIDQGIIPGDRRSGTTRNIGSKARKAMDVKLNIKRSYPVNYS